GEPFRLRVGRRKGSLGFLECTLAFFQGSDSGVGLFPDEKQGVPGVVPPGATVRIDLLTPAIVLDRHLRWRRHLTPQDFGLAREGFDASFSAIGIVAGWNAAHRLPKADQLAVLEGSSYLLEAVTDQDLEILRRAALAGVGARREEGFGAFAVRPRRVDGRD
ncbi:MAG: hypothetical protein ACRD2T_07740, partial [Thermoanaerobaculia bacterium]